MPEIVRRKPRRKPPAGSVANVPKTKPVRPFDQDQWDAVIRLIETGDHLREACETTGVDFRDFYGWIVDDDKARAAIIAKTDGWQSINHLGLSDKYAAALKARALIMQDQCIEDAHKALKSIYIDAQGNKRVDPGAVAGARLLIHVKHQTMARTDAGKFGRLAAEFGDGKLFLANDPLSDPDGTPD